LPPLPIVPSLHSLNSFPIINTMLTSHMNMVNQQLAQISTFNNLSINNLQNNISSEGNFLFVFYEL